MSCDRLYNLYKSSAGDEKKRHYDSWMQCRSDERTDTQAKQEASRAFYAQQAETAASIARGDQWKTLTTPTDIPGSDFILPSVQQQTVKGGGPKTSMVIIAVITGIIFVGGAIFALGRKPKYYGGRGRQRGYPQPYYSPRQNRNKKKRKKKKK